MNAEHDHEWILDDQRCFTDRFVEYYKCDLCPIRLVKEYQYDEDGILYVINEHEEGLLA